MKMRVKTFVIILTMLSCAAVLGQRNEISVGPAPIPAGKIENKLVTQLDNPASIAYGHLFQSGSTLSMPIPAGFPFNTMSLFQTPDFASSMTKGGNGNYYLISHTPSLYIFNNITGVVSLLGPITGLGELPNGISYNPVNGTYYIITAENLYSFDITTRAATLIGGMGVINSAFVDLCFNDAGACYAYDLATDASYIIDPATGHATFLSLLGYIANYGQGMSYDMETNTIYLSAFNLGTSTGQLRTMDPGTGATTLLVDWGNQQIAPFALNTQFDPPCTLGGPSNPVPANGASSQQINGITLIWTNGSGTTDIEIWFGPQGEVTKIYDGSVLTSYSLPTLEYGTKYLWWIVDKNSTCKTQGLPWSFTTIVNPNLVVAFYEPFDNMNRWTPIGPLGFTNWQIYNSNNAGGTPPELMLYYDPIFNGLSRILSSNVISSSNYANNISFRFYFEMYMTSTPVLGLGVTYDGGATSTMLWEEHPVGDINATEVSLSFTPAQNTYQLIFYFVGNSNLIDLWDIDDVQVDYIVPVELVSFSADVNDGVVELNWTTSTETNNRGFELQRSKGGEFESVAFIEGNGTTTEVQTYSYHDKNLIAGKYSYRLKQIDYDGSFEYSKAIEVEIPLASEYTLEQNYPNPFNPSTQINFKLASDAKVNLRVFDMLGQQVAVLVNENMNAGSHSVDFNASNLNSDVYMYRIEATGVDGSNFIDVRKMLLLK